VLDWRSVVPPTPTTYGEDAGKSTDTASAYGVPAGQSQTDASPEAANTVTPSAASRAIWSFMARICVRPRSCSQSPHDVVTTLIGTPACTSSAIRFQTSTPPVASFVLT